MRQLTTKINKYNTTRRSRWTNHSLELGMLIDTHGKEKNKELFQCLRRMKRSVTVKLESIHDIYYVIARIGSH